MQLLQRQALQQFTPRVAPITFREFGGPGVPGGPTSIQPLAFEGTDGGGDKFGNDFTPTIGPIQPFNPFGSGSPFSQDEIEEIGRRRNRFQPEGSGFDSFPQLFGQNQTAQPAQQTGDSKGATTLTSLNPAVNPFGKLTNTDDPFKLA